MDLAKPFGLAANEVLGLRETGNSRNFLAAPEIAGRTSKTQNLPPTMMIHSEPSFLESNGRFDRPAWTSGSGWP